MTSPTPPQGPKPGDPVIFDRFLGMNNTVAPERLTVGELERALNVDLDDTGHVRRRRGRRLLVLGDYHSLHRAKTGNVYVVKDQVIHRLNADVLTVLPEDIAPVGIASLGVSAGIEPLAYVDVGDRVYFSSSVASGIVNADHSVSPWGGFDSGSREWVSPVVRPSETLPEVRGKVIGLPPAATALAEHNGRVYLANGRVVWATELYRHGMVDKTKNFWQFEADVTMLAGVSNGLFVGTTQALWFVSGPFEKAKRERVMDSGVVPRSVVWLPSDAVLPPSVREGMTQTKPAIMFLTGDGVCVGLESGACFNLTGSKMTFPDAQAAAAVYRSSDGISQYVAVTETGGTPASAARFGDYVDAEIRRFQGA